MSDNGKAIETDVFLRQKAEILSGEFSEVLLGRCLRRSHITGASKVTSKKERK